MRRPILVAALGSLVALCAAAVLASEIDRHHPHAPPEPTGEHILVGTGCGPDRVVMVARSEDHFPASGCDAIDVHWLED